MSVITAAEAAVEKVFHEVETVAAEVDGAALAEARRLIAEAKAAELKVLGAAEKYKSELLSVLTTFGPEIVKAALPEVEKLISEIAAIFGMAAGRGSAQEPAE